MPKWLQVTFAACLIVIAISMAVLAFSRSNTREARGRDVAIVNVLSALMEYRVWAHMYYDRHGRFGALSEVAKGFAEPGKSTDLHILALGVLAFPSANGEAYLAIAKEDGIECAQVEHRGDRLPTAADHERWRLPKIFGWNPERIVSVACRRTGWPWSWLRWAGLDRISPEEMGGSLELAKMRGVRF